MSNFVVVVVYWGLLHEEVLARVSNSPHFGKMFGGATLHMYFIHIFPATACILNVMSTNCILRVSFWKATGTICFFYFTMLGAFSIKTGIVIYEFVNYKDYWTLVNILMVTSVACVVNCIFCLIDWKLKPMLRSQNYDYYYRNKSFDIYSPKTADKGSESKASKEVPKDLKNRV